MTNNFNISALICELNPLHFGHKAAFSYAHSVSEGVVCILSGNFVQRGEPAILDKWSRARLALECGADLVAELPLPWAMAGAERFARGGVALARALHCQKLVFGCETPEAPLLLEAARLLLSPAFTRQLQQEREQGLPFAKKREQAITALGGESLGHLLYQPNNILAMEYCKAILELAPALAPTPLLRTGAGHDAPLPPKEAPAGETLCASQLRLLLRNGEDIRSLVPSPTAALLTTLLEQGRCPGDTALLERGILARLRCMSPADFSHLPDLSEGLEHKLYSSVRQAGSLHQLYDLMKSKRYSHARIRRLVFSAFLGLHKALPPLPLYLRVLAMNPMGERILKNQRPQLPLVMCRRDENQLGEEALHLLHLEAQADDLYALSLPYPLPCGETYTRKLYKPPALSSYVD